MHVLAYHTICFAIIALVIFNHSLPIVIKALLILLLCYSTGPKSRVKPLLAGGRFNSMEIKIWYAGGAASGLVSLSSALAIGVSDPLGWLQAVAAGIIIWAFLFISFCDCRRCITSHLDIPAQTRGHGNQ